MSTQVIQPGVPQSVRDASDEHNGRYVEVNYQTDHFNVILWDNYDSRVSAGEQVFADVNQPDMKTYIIAWLKYGRVIF